ncbi:MAG: hypothetical protein KA713_09645 [Chryseotalea sp. WA131a]|nr:MAG: hypothetical protein KA713_09645 [Chryseotalea sp. WA131a]
MKNKIKFIPLFGFLLLFGCMAKPKQPPLTEREAEFFLLLSKECNCSVTRELDVRNESERINANDKGFYVISFDSLTLVPFNNIDSLKTSSFTIAKKLHNTVLNKDFKFTYDHITVFYSSPIDKVNSKIESFTYSLSDIK